MEPDSTRYIIQGLAEAESELNEISSEERNGFGPESSLKDLPSVEAVRE